MNSNINKAFTALRKSGLFARQNFKCCQSCACAEVPEGKDYVFYHQQDNASLKEQGKCHLAFGGKNPEAVGWKVVAILAQNGVRVNWDGNTDKRIMIYAS